MGVVADGKIVNCRGLTVGLVRATEIIGCHALCQKQVF